MKRQLGYVSLMLEKHNNCNILHYGSNKCQRIERSVMAAEIQALVLEFDEELLLQDLIKQILRKLIRIEAMIDINNVFNFVARDGKTTERRLQINIFALRQSYDVGELDRIALIPGTTNPADPVTKPILSTSSTLYQIMENNKFRLKPAGWAITHVKR